MLADVGRRLARTWASDVVLPGPGEGPSGWPHAFPLGQPDAVSLARDFPAVVDWVAGWRAFSAGRDVGLRHRSRRVHGTEQHLPTHLEVPDVDTAAALVGGGWPDRPARGRARAGLLDARFPHLRTAGLLAPTVAAVDDLSDTDLDLLARAGAWFAAHDATGLTPRQVPVEGLHAKWLDTRLHLVRRLADRADLGLAPRHPARVHLTYLDPAHRAAGGRWHDCVTVGDPMTPAYRPRVVVISENKDTAVHFPPVPAAVSVEGVGRGGAAVAAVDWLAGADVVVYWGDMDADGLEILDGFRAAGVPATSLFMDLPAFERWERFGTNEDPRGRPLQGRAPRSVPHLTPAESELYEALTSPTWPRVRRVEQERIPLDVAAAAVRRLVTSSR